MKHRMATGLLWLAPWVAGAQETSDLMKPVQSQIEQQNQYQQPSARPYVPGVTPRATPQQTEAREGTVSLPPGEAPPAEEPEGRGHGTAVLGDEVSPSVVEEGGIGLAPGRASRLHLIQPGETLWAISQRYFGTSAVWPRLWALNPSITNPHWIYPGDSLRLAPPATAALAPAPAPPPKPAAAPRPAVLKPVVPHPSGILLRRNGFVEAGDLAVAGSVIGSPDEKSLLSDLDEVYIDFKKSRGGKGRAGIQLQAGGRYTIYREISQVKHPKTHQLLGSLVEIVGEMELSEANPGAVSKGRIIEALGPIEREDRVGPLRRYLQLVEPQKALADLEGVVVTTIRPMAIVGQDVLVFIDRGSRDGIREGNRLQVVRRGDAYKASLEAAAALQDPRYPREVVAEILIVDVHERTSGGVVISSAKEVSIGDRVEMRRGN